MSFLSKIVRGKEKILNINYKTFFVVNVMLLFPKLSFEG